MNPNDQICQRPGCGKKRREHHVYSSNGPEWCNPLLDGDYQEGIFLPPTEPEAKDEQPLPESGDGQYWRQRYIDSVQERDTLRTQLAEVTKELHVAKEQSYTNGSLVMEMQQVARKMEKERDEAYDRNIEGANQSLRIANAEMTGKLERIKQIVNKIGDCWQLHDIDSIINPTERKV